MLPIKRAELIWVTVPTGTGVGTYIDFGVQPTLDGCLVVGFETFCADDLTVLPDNQPVITLADIVRATITLKDGAEEIVRDCPLITANAGQNAGVWKEIQPRVLDYQKSGVRVTAAFGTLPCAVPVLVYYWRPEEITWPKP